MRHIQLIPLLDKIFTNNEGKKKQKCLQRAHNKLVNMQPIDRKKHICRNGSNKWSPIKKLLTDILGAKCWYTECELIGAPLAIDHYRPVYDYWWLAFDPENYRVACPWANSPTYNATHECVGGKGDNFPLLPNSIRATNKNELLNEKPLILDPCKEEDCKLLAFQSDGRPILNPIFEKNTIARQRVEKSNILLNLDHPDFNTKREQLCNSIKENVNIYENLPVDSVKRVKIRDRLIAQLNADAPFSTAARFYLRLHRHLDWVENILNLSQHPVVL